MTNQKHILWQENEYAYPMSGGFVPFLTGYVHPDAKPRPAMVVAPGGLLLCGPQRGRACGGKLL